MRCSERRHRAVVPIRGPVAAIAEVESLGGMSELLAGKVQTGFGDASRWLKLFNAAYSQKTGMPGVPRLAEHRTRSRV